MFEVPDDYDFKPFSSTYKNYIINPYDRISLKVYPNKGQELTEIKANMANNTGITYVVEHDGLVKVPSLGRVKLAGLTIREAEKKLEEMYKILQKDPFVILEVINKRIIIFSNGSSKGKVIGFKDENFTLIEALAQAGGIGDFAKAYNIKILRGDLSQPDVFKYNIRKLKDLKNVNFRLQSNDIIYVEERPRLASKTLREITPYISLFTSFFTIYLLLNKK